MIRVAAIIGPTAVGKTEVAVAVAERLGAEIVSIDSMQIYRSLDAGTAKPSAEQRARVPHHLVDEVGPDHEPTVAEFQARARSAIEDISARGVLPLLVGGSGLYLRAVVDDLRFPPRAAHVRARLEAEARERGAPALHARLAALDPEAAARMEPTNERRVIRALEVVEVTGRPFSQDAHAWSEYRSRYRLSIAGLSRPRSELYERIAARADAMIASGLIEEARALAERGLSRSARQALGYRQVLDAPPDAGRDAIRDEVVRATKRFARRQESWFRADPRIAWFDATSPTVLGDVESYLRDELALTPGSAPS